MSPVRKWGPGPYKVAVIHGGPGAPGEVAPVARELSTLRGVIEPFQTKTTLDGQVQELKSVLMDQGESPFTLVGFSWGAYLSWILAARHPDLVKKLILVSSPPFEESYAESVTRVRMSRLTSAEKTEIQNLNAKLNDPTVTDKNAIMARIGSLLGRVDAFDPVHGEEAVFPCQYDVFEKVWYEASDLRAKQVLLNMAGKITCPVIAIHGDWDPHPAAGVSDPLHRALTNFRFVLLEKCGHRPWLEKNASERFFKLLAEEIH